MEYKVDISGVEYGMNDIQSAKIEHPLFDKLSVGNVCTAELELVIWQKEEIPKMAEIIPWCREPGEEWYQLGKFYIDTREQVEDKLEIIAYDGIRKSEIIWEPDQDLIFPMSMERASQTIAELIGTTLDPRCQFNSSYTIDYPANDYTVRDVLGYIASAHMGNWIATNEGKLLLVPLFETLPEETFYLVSEDGDAITFGDTRIIL